MVRSHQNGDHIYNGSVEEDMTAEEVYREITKEIVSPIMVKNYVLMIGCMNLQEKDKLHRNY